MGLGRRRAAVILVSAFCALLPLTAALAQDDGVLAVVVENGTAGAAVPGDLEVELLGFQGQVLAGSWRELARDATGRLSADGLNTDPEWTYVATATYQGLTFASAPVGFDAAASAQTRLLIFEPAAADPGAELADYALVLAREADGTRIRAVHTLTFQLPGDRALLVEPPNPLLQFPLPPATVGISALAGPAFWQVGPEGRQLLGGATLPPGQATFSFEYQFPWDRAGQELDIRPPVSTARFRVWAVESQVKISAPQLLQQPGLQMNERARLAIFEGQGLAAGAAIGLKISDPGYGLDDRLVTVLEERLAALAAVLLGLALVLAVVLRQLRNRRRRLLLARQLLAAASVEAAASGAADQLAEILADDPDLARRLRSGAVR